MSKDTDLSELDTETLVGHYMLAAIDQRFDDHEALGQECIRRGLSSKETHERSRKRLEEQASESKLSRPVVAAPAA